MEGIVTSVATNTIADEMTLKLKNPPQGTMRGHSFFPFFFGGCLVIGTSAIAAGIVMTNYVTLAGGIVLDVGSGVGFFVAKDLNALHSYVSELGEKVEEFVRYLDTFKQTEEKLEKVEKKEREDLKLLEQIQADSTARIKELEDAEQQQNRKLAESVQALQDQKNKAKEDIIKLEQQQTEQLTILQTSIDALEKGNQDLKGVLATYAAKEKEIDEKRKIVDEQIAKIHADANDLAGQVKAFNANNKYFMKEMTQDTSTLNTGVENLIAQVKVTEGIFATLKDEVKKASDLLDASKKELALAQQELEKDVAIDKGVKENIDTEKDLLQMVKSVLTQNMQDKKAFEAQKEQFKLKCIEEYKAGLTNERQNETKHVDFK